MKRPPKQLAQERVKDGVLDCLHPPGCAEYRSTEPQTGRSGRGLTEVLLISLLAMAAAAPGVSNLLIGDDYLLLHDAPSALDTRALLPFIKGGQGGAMGENYQPLVELVVGMEQKLWGLWVQGFHLVQLFLHVICSLLCYRLVRLLIPPRPKVALLAAAIFAVHPIHGDAIFWLAARGELLAGVFFLGSLVLFLRGRKGGDRQPTVWSLLLFLLALFCRGSAGCLPLVLFLVDVTTPSAASLSQRIWRHLPKSLPYLAVIVLFLVVKSFSLVPVFPETPAFKAGLYNLGHSLKLLLLPVETRTGLRGGMVLMMLGISCVTAYLSYARQGDRRNMFIATSWILFTLVPLLEGVHRRQLYLPAIGVCLFAGIIISGFFWQGHGERAVRVKHGSKIVLGLLLGACLTLMIRQGLLYHRASLLADQIIQGVKVQLSDLRPSSTLYVANLPGVLTTWSGDLPIFAFGLEEALTHAYGFEVHSKVLSTRYLKDLPDDGDPSLEVTPEGIIKLAAPSFSFHSPSLTTGRDRLYAGLIVHLEGWTTVIEALEGKHVTRLLLRPSSKLKPLLTWTGREIRRIQ